MKYACSNFQVHLANRACSSPANSEPLSVTDQRHDFGQYSDPICNQAEAASDVTSGMAVEGVGLNVHLNFDNSRSTRSCVMLHVHFAMDGQQQTTTM